MTLERANPRGPLSSWLLMYRPASGSGDRPVPVPERGTGFGDDVQLALYLCYEGHYSDVPGVSFDEWDPSVIEFRRSLEREFEACLSERIERGASGDPRRVIPEIIAADTSRSLSRYMEELGSLDHMREFVIHRSAYQLKEADPHTFAIPRIHGRAKQFLAAIQAGEYGADAPDRLMHSELFAQTMRALGLDDRRHAYLDRLPASALMVSNLISLFALNRRWRGALVGHLAVFEMTSVIPMGRYSRALERLGAPTSARRFYDVHVLADAEHEVMALEMAGALVDEEPRLGSDVLFGAGCVNEVERMFSEQLLSGWALGSSGPVAA